MFNLKYNTAFICVFICSYGSSQTEIKKEYLYSHWKLETLVIKDSVFMKDTLSFENLSDYIEDHPLASRPSFFLDSFWHRHKTRLVGLRGNKNFGFYFNNDSDTAVRSISIIGKWKLESIGKEKHLVFFDVEIKNESNNRSIRTFGRIEYKILCLDQNHLIMMLLQ